MTIAEALVECMREQNLRDEQVAVMVGVSAQTVMKWRSRSVEPRLSLYNSLRRNLKGFAQRIDSAAA